MGVSRKEGYPRLEQSGNCCSWAVPPDSSINQCLKISQGIIFTTHRLKSSRRSQVGINFDSGRMNAVNGLFNSKRSITWLSDVGGNFLPQVRKAAKIMRLNHDSLRVFWSLRLSFWKRALRSDTGVQNRKLSGSSYSGNRWMADTEIREKWLTSTHRNVVYM